MDGLEAQIAAARGFYFALCCAIVFWLFDAAVYIASFACVAGGLSLALETWTVSLAQYIVGFAGVIVKIGVVFVAIRLACATPQARPFWLWPILMVSFGLLILPIRMFLPVVQSYFLSQYAPMATLADAYYAAAIRNSILAWADSLMYLGLVLFAFVWWWRAATADPNREMA
ncbi:MAG: hypothetical protein HN348_06050 [Proteobacteria bacterium]|jgi:hypothetical protein|nr:hypothetical protein [Pseudomonadota bacterium]